MSPSTTISFKVLQLDFFLLEFWRTSSHSEIHISDSLPKGPTGRPKTNKVFFNNPVGAVIVFIHTAVKYCDHV